MTTPSWARSALDRRIRRAVLARRRVTPLQAGMDGYNSELVRTELDEHPDGRR